MKINKLIALLLLVSAVATLSGCKKDNNSIIIGKWTNTANSGEITIAGLQSIPADCITMEFTANEVLVGDIRVNCPPKKVGYTLSEKDGKQILHFNETVCLHETDFIVEKLDKDQMVLASTMEMIDWSFHYVMKRSK